MKHLFVLTVLFAFTLIGCKKGEDAQPQTITQQITRTWKAYKVDVVADSKSVGNFYTKGGKTNDVDFDSFVLVLNADGSFTESDLDAQGKPYTDKGTWKTLNSDKNLEFKYPDGTSISYDIISTSPTELIYSLLFPVAGAAPQDIKDFAADFGVTPKTSYGIQFTLRP